ncbi:MAG: LpxI family protein [Candidatus Aminicenantes bacterium]|nr:LpxI family protein [Candidatus Aminicenantes bacterium]
MGRRLGVIAGGGEFPLRAVAEIQKTGAWCAVAGVRGAAAEDLERAADAFEWVGAFEIRNIVDFFRNRDVREVVLVGKVEHRLVVGAGAFDEGPAALLARLPDLKPETLLRAVVGRLEAEGLSVLDPGFLLRPYLCPAGVLGRVEPSAAVLADIEFGYPLAKRLADLDIGQTLVVKSRAVVAVEGMEGTDATIRRSRGLAGEGVVVIKVGRTAQDMRVDVPAVGRETVASLVEAGAAALCFEAATTPFFQKEEAVALADGRGLVLMAR